MTHYHLAPPATQRRKDESLTLSIIRWKVQDGTMTELEALTYWAEYVAQHPTTLLPSHRYQPVPVTTNSEQLPAPREA